MTDPPRIVFMGTPEFAVPSLRALALAGFNVVGVVTTADKYGGRGGKKLLQPPVKRAAVTLGIPVLQPRNLKAPDFIEDLKALRADLQIVVAFRMLPAIVWSMPDRGTFNLHGSLLPKYRGAAPINWAVINGETHTGVTTFFIRQEIDTGDVLLTRTLPIGENDTAGDVHDRMMEVGAELVVETVRLIESGEYRLKKQNDEEATAAPKIDRATCEIDWDRPAQKVHDFIRGLSPYPAAWTMMNNAQLKIIRSRVETDDHDLRPGTVITDDRQSLRVATASGFVDVLEVQLAGRRRMQTPDFLRGTSLPPDLVLG